MVAGEPLVLADVPVVVDDYETPFEEAPLDVPLSEKVDMLIGVTTTMGSVDGIALARGSLAFWDTDKWFVSSQGARIHQHLV